MERGGAVLQREMSNRSTTGYPRVVCWLAAGLAAAALSACSSINDKLAGTASEAPAIGLPAGTPARPSGPAPYLAVHDIPTPRSGPTLTALEQKKLEDDLVAARADQQKLAAPPEPPPPPPPPEPAKKVTKKTAKKEATSSAPRPPSSPPPEQPNAPISSARSIY
jgi:hypothetical protein